MKSVAERARLGWPLTLLLLATCCASPLQLTNDVSNKAWREECRVELASMLLPPTQSLNDLGVQSVDDRRLLLTTGMPDQWILDAVASIKTVWNLVDLVQKRAKPEVLSSTQCLSRLWRTKDRLYRARSSMLSFDCPAAIEYLKQAIHQTVTCANSLSKATAIPFLPGALKVTKYRRGKKRRRVRKQRLVKGQITRWPRWGRKRARRFRRFTDTQLSAFRLLKVMRDAVNLLRNIIATVKLHDSAAPPTAPPPTTPLFPPPAKTGPRKRSFILYNYCPYTVWIGTQSNRDKGPVYAPSGSVTTGWTMEPSTKTTVTTDGEWGGRFWARTGCKGPVDGYGFFCDTGDCGGTYECQGKGGNPPATLAEFQLTMDISWVDFYDVSAVDGYNVEMQIVPLTPDTTCKSVGCDKDLNAYCMKELQKTDDYGRVVGCYSACSAPKIPHGPKKEIYCCIEEYVNATLCTSKHPTVYSAHLKSACPSAYSYAYDDNTRSLYACRTLPAYEIHICGKAPING